MPLSRADIADIKRRHARGERESTISKATGRAKRTVTEVQRALSAVPEIAKRVGKRAKDGGIIIRVAARASDLPKAMQKKIAPKLAGAFAEKGLAVVQAGERELGIVQRGRRPGSGRGPRKRVQVHLRGLTKMPLSLIRTLKSTRNEIDKIIAAHESAWAR